MPRKQTVKMKINHTSGVSELNVPDANDDTINRARCAQLFIAGALTWPKNKDWQKLKGVK